VCRDEVPYLRVPLPPPIFSLPISPSQGGTLCDYRGRQKVATQYNLYDRTPYAKSATHRTPHQFSGVSPSEIGLKQRNGFCFWVIPLPLAIICRNKTPLYAWSRTSQDNRGKIGKLLIPGRRNAYKMNYQFFRKRTFRQPRYGRVGFYLMIFNRPEYLYPQTPSSPRPSWFLYYTVTNLQDAARMAIQYLLHPDTNIAQWQKTFERQFPGTAGDVKRNRAAFQCTHRAEYAGLGRYMESDAWQVMSRFCTPLSNWLLNIISTSDRGVSCSPQWRRNFSKIIPNNDSKSSGNKLDILCLTSYNLA